jgi:hypothetical protein
MIENPVEGRGANGSTFRAGPVTSSSKTVAGVMGPTFDIRHDVFDLGPLRRRRSVPERD